MNALNDDDHEKLAASPLSEDLAASVVRILESAQRNFDDRDAALASLARAASLIQIEIDRKAAPRSANALGVLAGWQVNRVKAYIDANLDTPIHIQHLAAIARRSSDYFGRAFKRTVGETPHGFIVARRVRRAGELMLESDLGLAEIAATCGFADQAHLSKAFRRNHGQSPAVWRRERREYAVAGTSCRKSTGIDENLPAVGARNANAAFIPVASSRSSAGKNEKRRFSDD
jgi:AraC family transcriptional regulator